MKRTEEKRQTTVGEEDIEECHMRTEISETLKSLWSKYRKASERFQKDNPFTESRNISINTENSPEILSINGMERRKYSDHNSNRLSEFPRSSSIRELLRQLELITQDNHRFSKAITEKNRKILELEEENTQLRRQIEILNNQQPKERRKWETRRPSPATNRNIHSSSRKRSPAPRAPPLPEISSAHRLPTRKDSFTTYSSSSVAASSSTTTPKGPPKTPLTATRARSEYRHRKSASFDSSIFNQSATAPYSLAYYLESRNPEFIASAERRQRAIRRASSARHVVSQERRKMAQSVVEGKSSYDKALPFLQTDTTQFKAFKDEEIRSATKKRYKETHEFQQAHRSRQEKTEKAVNQLLTKCYILKQHEGRRGSS